MNVAMTPSSLLLLVRWSLSSEGRAECGIRRVVMRKIKDKKIYSTRLSPFLSFSPPYSPQLHVWAGFENPDMPCYFVETKIPRALGRLHTGRPVVAVTPKSLLQTIATGTGNTT
jgi:hypothetical protein